ncbi:MAG: AMP-binding protein [Oligoflexia bacterium]|nr:AMP-binding protein [Oligoflexia bacterium]
MQSTHNLTDFIISKTQKFSSQPSFIIKETSGFRRPLSFLEFNDLVLKASFILEKKFLSKGFKIGLWGENSVEWCVMALATWRAGGVLVPLMHIASEAEVTTIIKTAGLDALFISPKLYKNNNHNVSQVYALDFKIRKSPAELQTLGELLQQVKFFDASKMEPTKTKAEDLAILIFTSGTTGYPKGVMLSHKNVITNILDVIDIIPTDGVKRLVSVLPLSHMFELVGGFIVVHLKGACISYPDSLKPDDVIKELKAQKATALASVPLFFEILDRTIEEKIKALPKALQVIVDNLKKLVLLFPPLGKVFFSNIHDGFGGEVKYFMSGGAKIDPQIIERFKSVGIQMFQGYGLTETSPVISFTSIGQDKYGSVGKVVNSLKIKIHEPINGEGEICVKGPSVFMGYFNNPEATSAVIKDGWFHTGDIGHVDDEGFVFITGRKKDIIVTPNGKNVYPEEVEYYLKDSPHFQEVSVLGIDQGRGEVVHAVLVTNLDSEKTWKEIERLSEKLADYKKVAAITITQSELPKTVTKKVKKHVLREIILNNQWGSSGGSEAQVLGEKLNLEDVVESWVSEKIIFISKKENFVKQSSLRNDLGIDSLTFMELISAAETKWEIGIADEDFEKIVTVNDFVKVCRRGKVNQQRSAKKMYFNYKANNYFWMNFFRLLFNIFIIRPFVKICFKHKVNNISAISSHQNFLITPNHTSHLDLLAIYASLPITQVNKTYAVAADDYFFNNYLKAFTVRLLFNAVPFKRRARIDESFRICEQILKEGGNLLIYPEGTRSTTGKLSEFKPGVGRLVAGEIYSVVPAYIKGAYDAFPKGSFFPRFLPVEVTFAQARKFTDFDKEDKKSLAEVAKLIEQDIRLLGAN